MASSSEPSRKRGREKVPLPLPGEPEKVPPAPPGEPEKVPPPPPTEPEKVPPSPPAELEEVKLSREDRSVQGPVDGRS
jgi:hypothetical protein